MLLHLGQAEAAGRAHNAWLRALEDGQMTGDIVTAGSGIKPVGTRAFADAVIDRLERRFLA